MDVARIFDWGRGPKWNHFMTFFGDVIMTTSLKWCHNFFKFNFTLISLKNHNLAKSRNFKSNQIFITLAYWYLFGCHEWAPISTALRQSPLIKVAAVASHWQHVGDLIVSGFEPHTFRNRDRQLQVTNIEV